VARIHHEDPVDPGRLVAFEQRADFFVLPPTPPITVASSPTASTTVRTTLTRSSFERE
jgi:hypothetical protein